MAGNVDGTENATLVRLAHDPAPGCRLQALHLSLRIWRKADPARGAEIMAVALDVVGGLDYFARFEFAEQLVDDGEAVPHCVAIALGDGEPAIGDMLGEVGIVAEDEPPLPETPAWYGSPRQAEPLASAPPRLAPAADAPERIEALRQLVRADLERRLQSQIVVHAPSTAQAIAAPVDVAEAAAAAPSDIGQDDALVPTVLDNEPQKALARPAPRLQIVPPAPPPASGHDLIDLALEGSTDQLVQRLSLRSGRPQADVAACLAEPNAEALGALVRDAGCGPALLVSLVATLLGRNGFSDENVAAMRAWEAAEPRRPRLRAASR